MPIGLGPKSCPKLAAKWSCDMYFNLSRFVGFNSEKIEGQFPRSVILKRFSIGPMF